jgi:hypothetical protein
MVSSRVVGLTNVTQPAFYCMMHEKLEGGGGDSRSCATNLPLMCNRWSFRLVVTATVAVLSASCEFATNPRDQPRTALGQDYPMTLELADLLSSAMGMIQGRCGAEGAQVSQVAVWDNTGNSGRMVLQNQM